MLPYMHLKLQEEDAMWHINSSLCGPHSLHVSPCSIATSIFSCIYLFISFIKFYSILMFKYHSLSLLFKIPNLLPQPRKLVIFLLGNYLTLSINLENSHEYGKCDYAIATQWKIWDMALDTHINSWGICLIQGILVSFIFVSI